MYARPAVLIGSQWKRENLLGAKLLKFTEMSTPHGVIKQYTITWFLSSSGRSLDEFQNYYESDNLMGILFWLALVMMIILLLCFNVELRMT